VPPAVTVKPVKLPAAGVVPPIAPGEANVAPPNVEAFTAALHPNPVEVVQIKASAAAEQLGIANAVGDAELAVPLPTTVLAVCVASPVNGTSPA
jgi:hypothetical protein